MNAYEIIGKLLINHNRCEYEFAEIGKMIDDITYNVTKAGRFDDEDGTEIDLLHVINIKVKMKDLKECIDLYFEVIKSIESSMLNLTEVDK